MSTTVQVLALRPFRVRGAVFAPGAVAELALADAGLVLETNRARLVDPADVALLVAEGLRCAIRDARANARAGEAPRGRWPA